MKKTALTNGQLDSELEKKYRRQDRQKSKKMKVSGKSVFKIKRIKDRRVGS